MYSDSGILSEEEEDDPIEQARPALLRLLGWKSVGTIGVALAFLSMNGLVIVDWFGAVIASDLRRAILVFAFALGLLAAPFTHLLAARRGRHAGYSAFQPFVGGFTFVVLQAVGWTCWGCFLVLLAWISVYGGREVARGLMSTAGLTGLVAQVFVLASVHYFSVLETQPRVPPVAGPGRPPATTVAGRPWNTVALVGLLLAVISFMLAVAVESLEWDSMLPVTISATLVALPITHFMAGTRRHGPRFVIPFTGGRKFVWLQGVGWTLWSLALIASGIAVYLRWYVSTLGAAAAGGNGHDGLPGPPEAGAGAETETETEAELAGETGRRPWQGLITAAGVGGVLAQAAVLLSLHFFDRSLSAQWSRQLCRERRPSELAVAAAVAPRVSLAAFSWSDWKLLAKSYLRRPPTLRQDLWDLAVVVFIYTLPLTGTVAVFAPFVWIFLQPSWGSLAVLLVLVSAYSQTYRGAPHITGRRSWPAVRRSELMWESVRRYFHGRLLVDGKPEAYAAAAAASPAGAPPEPRKFIFGFHPHGIYPLTAFWITRTRPWREAFERLAPGAAEVDVLGATVIYYCPVIREFALWSGGRDVSRESIAHALGEGRSVMLVPGGQREMRHSAGHQSRYLVILKRHKGFIRAALREGADLVPVLSFGEDQVLCNIRAPRMQAWTTKVIGFGLPTYPHGAFYSPVPGRQPLTVVVGEPIRCAHLRTAAPDQLPLAETVDRLFEEYYGTLEKLFYKYRAEAGFPEMELRWAYS